MLPNMDRKIPEPLGSNPSGSWFIQRAFSALAQKLASTAVTVAESLVAADDGDKQRHKKIDHTQPRKENVKEAKREVNNCPNP